MLENLRPMATQLAERTDTDQDRERQYFRYLIEKGAVERYGIAWETPERVDRIDMEVEVIVGQGFQAAFIMLAGILDFCRRENIPYGPGRGSVGGCYVAYLMGIHEVDSIEFGLYFERFLNAARVSFPDVDLDFSQRDRDKVIEFIRQEYHTGDQIVMQVGAFVKAGAKAVVDLVEVAMRQNDDQSWATATNLKKCLPEGNVTGGVKVQRELSWWMDKDGDAQEQFKAIAEQAGWYEALMKLDGAFTHVGRHAAGVVILRSEDLPVLPRAEVRNPDGSRSVITAYDMYALDALGYLKWDILGLRTLDVLADAHRFIGGDGSTRALMDLWRKHRDDPDIYEVFQEADTTGIFQMETPGYKRTLRAFQPNCFDHIVQLVALYRPGALDFKREDGKNMVEVFIERRHGREPAQFDVPELIPVLRETHGIMVYQEQQMAVARALAGFTMQEADMLRKAIGKKRPKEMAALIPLWQKGTQHLEPVVRDRWWENLEAAARYSWNKAHAVEYGIITWLTAFFKKRYPSAFYAAEINSWEAVKDRQANVIAEARQHVEFAPPDINIAEDKFIPAEIPAAPSTPIVFGLNGIKGMGDSYRNALLVNRMLNGPFISYAEFVGRVEGTVPSNIKKSLIGCGAFDSIGEDRVRLLASIPKPGKDPTKRYGVYEHIDHNRKLKKPRPLPDDFTVYEFPTDTDLAKAELDAMGYYISKLPMADVEKALRRVPTNCIGGEIATIKIHNDRNDNEMATLQITTPALTRQRVRIFASNWSVWGHHVEKGKKLLFRGRMDGDTYLADAAWAPDDYRHFRKIRIWRGEEPPETRDFDGRLEVIQSLESAGARVRCL